MSENSKKHFYISFNEYSVFLKNDQLKMLNRKMYSMTIFDNFDFFPMPVACEVYPSVVDFLYV